MNNIIINSIKSITSKQLLIGILIIQFIVLSLMFYEYKNLDDQIWRWSYQSNYSSCSKDDAKEIKKGIDTIDKRTEDIDKRTQNIDHTLDKIYNRISY